eukprot:2759794-Ditylum_brightwellii.AAC.1
MSPATPWSWKSLIELNEKASGQNVTDIWAPAATMEIVVRSWYVHHNVTLPLNQGLKGSMTSKWPVGHLLSSIHNALSHKRILWQGL